MPRPMVPAPTTAMVFTSMQGFSLRFRTHREYAVSRFVEANDDSRALRKQRPTNQVRTFGHQLDGFYPRRRLLGHFSLPVKFVTRIQEFPVIPVADELIQFGFRKRLLVEIAGIEVELQLEQETSCFAASGSSGLLVEHEFGRHVPPMVFERRTRSLLRLRTTPASKRRPLQLPLSS